MADETSEAPPAIAPKPAIIIIKRKKAGSERHHGGAWKVAYADFVTAMMALFIVLWLMSADKEVQESVASYFKDPTGSGKQAGTAVAGSGHSIEVPKEDMAKLREKIEQAVAAMPNFRELKDHVEMTITPEGLRIEMLESETGVFFESGRPTPNPVGTELLVRLSEEMGKLPNGVLIEGHTDSTPFPGEQYSNWELSSDRANAARKIMTSHGLRAEQVTEVRGYADRQLRHPENPGHASNRRISLIVKYQVPAETHADAGKAAAPRPKEH